MIAAAMWFNSGILLCADAGAEGPAGAPSESHTIFPRQYGSSPGGPRSIFVISELGDRHVAAFQECERALAALPPAECTIDRMRRTVERSLIDVADGEVDFVAFYSPTEQRYSLFRVTGTMLQEVVGYDCEGSAAFLGHTLIHDRYDAARSMDTLDLSTVFSIAADTLERIRATRAECGKCSEMVVMYADGHVSEVQRIQQDNRKKRLMALSALGRT